MKADASLDQNLVLREAPEICRRARSDPQLNIEVISPPYYAALREALKKHPDYEAVSEWQHPLVGGDYEIRVHSGKNAEDIHRVWEAKYEGGPAQLRHVYTKQELEYLIQAEEAA